jgi:membrane protein required for colicin V production
MIRQVVTLAGVVAGYIISLKLYDSVAHAMPKSMEPGTAKAISFVLIFIVCILSASILAAIGSKIFKIAGLSWANRLGGGLLGFLKGFLLIAIIVTVLIAFLPAGNSLLNSSVTLPYVISGIKIISGIIPDDIQTKYKDKVDDIRNSWIQRGVKEGIEKEKKNGHRRREMDK